MKDYIIGVVLSVVLFLAIWHIVKKKKNKASCCGSGAYAEKSRKLKNVVCKKIFVVEGMHCQNCVNRVMEAVQDLGGTSASVNLKKGLLTVSMEKEIDDTAIIEAVEKRGYKIVKRDSIQCGF